MTEDSRRIPSAPCPDDPHNCELLLRSREAYHERFAKAEISGHEAVVSTMAVGLVIDVWRNGPVEDMHCGKSRPSAATGDRREADRAMTKMVPVVTGTVASACPVISIRDVCAEFWDDPNARDAAVWYWLAAPGVERQSVAVDRSKLKAVGILGRTHPRPLPIWETQHRRSA